MKTDKIDIGYENLKDDEWRNWLDNLSEEELIEVYKKALYELEHEDPKIKHERYESMVRSSIEEDADDDWSEYEESIAPEMNPK